ncbi:methyltransferase domain-containing protein [Thermodesulfobacteriota bacterium]
MTDEQQILILREHCFVCGREADFFLQKKVSLLLDAVCEHCGARKRTSDTAHAIFKACLGREDGCLRENWNELASLHVYLAESTGILYECLRRLPWFVCSEHLEGSHPGSDSLDLVIMQDILEHVSDFEVTFNEIHRVLRPDGLCIFTVPYHEGHNTQRRAEVNTSGSVTHLLPPVYHEDPMQPEGILVFTDFGCDLPDLLARRGMSTEDWLLTSWHEPKEVTWITDGEEYTRYWKHYRNRTLFSAFRYNAHVFISHKQSERTGNGHLSQVFRKPSSAKAEDPEQEAGVDGESPMLQWDGERFLPWLKTPFVHYEHLHRYLFSREFVEGGKVLDLACGEGYGSFMLAERAKEVVGVDINATAIKHARAKYAKENLNFIQGSMTAIPIGGGAEFDVIVCFEAIEHIKEHQELIGKVKQLLKEEGIFLVSTPNTAITSFLDLSENPFHLKELSFDAFNSLLSRSFKYVAIYGQEIYPASHIFPLVGDTSAGREYLLERIGLEFSPVPPEKKVARYFIALASDRPLEARPKNSYVLDLSRSAFPKGHPNKNKEKRKIRRLKRMVWALSIGTLAVVGLLVWVLLRARL